MMVKTTVRGKYAPLKSVITEGPGRELWRQFSQVTSTGSRYSAGNAMMFLLQLALWKRSRSDVMRHFILRHCLVPAFGALAFFSTSFAQSTSFIRINQVGYLASDSKIAIAFSRTQLQGNFVLRDASNRVEFRGPLKSVRPPGWGGLFPHYYELDFSS